MPGPKEPKTDEINNYLEPMVDELIQLYCGIRILTFKSPAGEVIRAALMMVACDIPAARKTGGFTAHNSTCVCFKCNCHFTRLDSTNKVDFRGFCGISECIYCLTSVGVTIMTSSHKSALGLPTKLAPYRSDTVYLALLHYPNMNMLLYVINPTSEYLDHHRFKESEWCHCNYEENRLHAEEWKSTVIISERQHLEIEKWCSMWIECGVLRDRDFTAMQKIADKMIVPRRYTALKSKIDKKIAFMKVDEWKLWVLVYSPVMLKSVLSSLHFNNWIDFVYACRHLVKPSITFDDINTNHRHLENFCEKCNEIYTIMILTCNMHLRLHL
ncbi:hypothetical protein PHYBLDRAFT_72764 [Phycomyces blakesleeanus NRRL 1555(-)]|uniref:Uncharacterized protein n=1 Tax=Phycomyces blakesleeanus (strain ATCC 8743b / DSM 1359 / FGSC 10004 / NBRC 33097 / NRRL 1555) TaxID=763407 RepID=A0A162VAK6_PHYB8|nr:hypothetical protein PHYBLDRAFT_72764 [Phycomyces blakesleeanus NRRL 1555(-)]OAD81252.1 hypothetical protein PHYBLDRAFT_72764 [Phycomyces blakesleeanus NRRL 1555(-)]|eukprot:XP_018299292.1 hypothetical protein PHYBLDRAFT_72764 [Phycomyces blakesleeanus NRRL 1555(-)]